MIRINLRYEVKYDRTTHEKQTPATTGIRVSNFLLLQRLLRRIKENMIVKKGVEARTT